MNATGIGFAGIDGCWWLPAAEPATLPAAVFAALQQVGDALFTLFDAAAALYQVDPSLTRLLEHKAPLHLREVGCAGPVLSLRPDFQLVPEGDSFRLVATELEMCPAAQGFAHAMQAGYGLEPDLAQAFAAFLDGRELLFAGTHHWSEFLFEQLAFCRALAAVGGRGRVLYDRPLAAIAAEAQQGLRWRPPMFGIRARPAAWDVDVLARIARHGLAGYVWPDAGDWPQEVGDAVVFRFGYVNQFDAQHLAAFCRWQQAGATLLNPPLFWLDNKALMAALALPALRARIRALDPTALPVLDRCLPETTLLTPEQMLRLTAERERWLVKFAGFDDGQASWGGRSLQIGAEHTPESWRRVLQQGLDLPWPVVAQRLTPSAPLDIAYVDGDGQRQVMRQGATRLRAFFLAHTRAGTDAKGHARTGAGLAPCTVAGVHLTVNAGGLRVSEATTAVQAPVRFV